MRKFAPRETWWCQLKLLMETRQLGQLLLCQGGGFSADQPRGGLQGGWPSRFTQC